MIIVALLLLIFLYWLYTKNFVIRWSIVVLVYFLYFLGIYSIVSSINFSNISDNFYQVIEYFRPFTITSIIFGFSKFNAILFIGIDLFVYWKIKVHEIDHFFIKDKYNKRYMTKEPSKKKVLKKLYKTVNKDDLHEVLAINSKKPLDIIHISFKKFYNALVVGIPGSGKTVTLINFIRYAWRKGNSVIAVDGKGQIGDDTLHDEMKNDAHVFDINNRVSNVKYNPFNSYDYITVADMILSLTEWSEAHYEATFRYYITIVLRTMEFLDIPFSLDSIIENFSTQSLVEKIAARRKIAKDKDEQEYLKELGKEVVIAKVYEKQVFEAVPRIKQLVPLNIFSSDKDAISCLDVFDNNESMLFLLDPLSKEKYSSLIGTLITIDLKSAVSMTKNKGYKLAIFDEIGAYFSKNIINMLNKGRAFGLRIINGMQSISDINIINDDLTDLVIDNTDLFVTMLQNEGDNVEKLCSIYGTQDSAKKSYSMDGDDESSERGTIKESDRFFLHPNVVKSFQTGEAAYLSKKNDEKYEKVYFRYESKQDFMERSNINGV